MSSLRRFDLAPPRRFLFPAVLLLLAEEPGYGYRLVKERDGLPASVPTDRPSVYRTLAQLERDGLVASWSDEAKSAQSRRLYRLTPEGERALRVVDGRDQGGARRLDAVLRRYAASRAASMPRSPGPKAAGAPCRPARCHRSRPTTEPRPDRLGGRATRRRARARPARPGGRYHGPLRRSSPTAPPCSSRPARRSVR